MANTLNNLIPDLYVALDVVSRELTGFIPAVTMDAQAARAAVGQAVRVSAAPAAAATDITPGVNPPDDGDQTIGNTPITITKARRVPFRWNGEQQLGVSHGPGYLNIRQGQIAQAIRTLVNEVEVDIGATYKRASRAYGTAGTTPFGTAPNYVVDDAAQVLKILKDNGVPSSDLQLVVDTGAGAKMLSIPGLNQINKSGDEGLLRQGIFGNLFAFAVRESAGVNLHTKGTGTGYLTNDASLGIGDTAIAVDTGSGTIVAGDVVTFAADAANKYLVGTTLASSEFSLNAPGLRAAIADSNAITVGANYRANMAFHRSAIILAARAPALPEEGDSAIDRTIVTDPRSGLSFEVAMYAQYRQIQYEISLAWGVANIKPEHTAILLG